MSYVGDPDDPGYLRKTRRFKQPSCNQNVTLSTCLVLMKHSDRNRICSTFGLSVCIFFHSDVKRVYYTKNMSVDVL